jgi:hypothetical protein
MPCEHDDVSDWVLAVPDVVEGDAVELREVSPERTGEVVVVLVLVDQLAEPLDSPTALV